MSDVVAVLDVGSGQIRVFVGKRGINNTIIISGIGCSDYAGFSDGQWLEPERFIYAVGHAISEAESNSRIKINEIFVGVPADFSVCVCNDVNISFSRKRKITDDDIAMLHGQGDNFSGNSDYTLIHSQPIYYTLDDDRRLIHPVGLPSTRLGGSISYILAEKKFVDFVSSALDNLGVGKIEFVSSTLAETLFLFDDMKRDQYVILIDVGYISSSVTLARGDGILSQFSFPLGGGYITGELAMALRISFEQAEKLKRQVLLSVEHAENDTYEISVKNENYSFNAQTVNEIVMVNIAKIASAVQKCLRKSKYDYPDHVSYYLTGGGLAYIYGAKDVMSDLLERPVELISPKLPHYGKPHLSSVLGILDTVLSGQESEKPKNIFAKLFSKLGGN